MLFVWVPLLTLLSFPSGSAGLGACYWAAGPPYRLWIFSFVLHHFSLLSSFSSYGFLGGSEGKESACNSGDPDLIPGSGRSPEEGKGYPLQYSCLENLMDRGAWQATVHGVAKSQDDWAINNVHFHFSHLALIPHGPVLAHGITVHSGIFSSPWFLKKFFLAAWSLLCSAWFPNQESNLHLLHC